MEEYRRELIIKKAQELDKAKMIRFDENNGYFQSLDIGRIASHFYIKTSTIETFLELQRSVMDESKIIEMVAQAQEFDQLKVSRS